MGRIDAESETLIPANRCEFDEADVAHSLRAEGFDASEDGTGRGTPLVPVMQQPFSIMPMNSGTDYKARPTDVAQPIMAGGPTTGNQGGDLIAFTCKDHGADADEAVSPTLRSMGHDASHANGGGQVAIAFHNRQDPDVSGDVSHPLGAKDNGMGDAHPIDAEPYTIMERGRSGESTLEYRQDGSSNAILTPNGGRGGLGVGAVAARWGVRRLTPRECERLQAFPDDFTAIEWRGKAADKCPDGPRYKALGNSMAVNVMAWLGERIDAVEAAAERRDAA